MRYKESPQVIETEEITVIENIAEDKKQESDADKLFTSIVDLIKFRCDLVTESIKVIQANLDRLITLYNETDD